MWKKKNLVFLFIYTLLFSALIFVGRSIFFPSLHEEEKYVEISLYDATYIPQEYESFSWVTQDDITPVVAELIYEEFSQKYKEKQKDKVQFRYIPSLLFDAIQYSYLPIAETYFFSRSILSKVDELNVFLYKSPSDTRGRMKSKIVHIYGVESLGLEEFLWVLIHEFAHYVDIYSLPKSAFGDESQKFYDIAWESVNHVKAGLDASDFVSGYAMTNQYEDFAETYLYYVLHNKEFLKKAEESDILAKKFTYFQTYIFPRNLFYKEDFSEDHTFKEYYWDITKLPVDIKKFLQYMQSDI